MSKDLQKALPSFLRREMEALTPDNWARIRATIARNEAEALLAKLERPPSLRGRLTRERVEAMTRTIRMSLERSA